ncbi:High-affinity glucose transporter [Elsinoe australis]|uniref:High-affinity glucose transporter n=1 Tax=Elsinoe australis TaxID=40998 RepID=A0A2P7YD81_9PEZI|nr:High-affinity glucose transporter [Elsinoe australis]
MFSFKPGKQTELAVTITCLQAFLLFGYDQGVFGGLVTNDDFLNTFGRPNSSLLGIIVSIYNIGCLLGCIANFIFGTKFGRRQAIWAAMAFICLGAVVQTASYGVPQLMVGRVITGFGVGIDTSTVPMYQSELCKPNRRGRLVSTELLFVAVGITFAYFYDFGLSYVGGPMAWRLPIATQIAFAIPIAILMIPLPESPRWLIQRGRVDDATKVLMQNYGVDDDDEELQTERKSIIDICDLERKAGFHWTSIFKKDAVQTGWRIFLSCLILTMNQWTGINVVVFYAAVVLEQNYMIFFGVSMAGIPWCYSAEILPLHVRAPGISIAVMFNWISVFTIVMITPVLVSNITWKTYLIFMVMNFVFIPIIYFLFPETANRSLEDIDFLFLKHDRLSPDEQHWIDRYGMSGVANEPVVADRNLESKNTAEHIEHSKA